MAPQPLISLLSGASGLSIPYLYALSAPEHMPQAAQSSGRPRLHTAAAWAALASHIVLGVCGHSAARVLV